jgi:hypothetical protein
MVEVFLNLTTQNNYQEIFDEIISYCSEEFYKIINSFNILIIGDGNLILPDNPKFKIIERITDINVYGEFVTLNYIREFARKNTDSKALYLHSKCTNSENNSCIVDWRRYMCYFNIKRFDLCLNTLEDNDTCGVDLVNYPSLHYSGNYWWANTNWINNLDSVESQPIIISERHKCEFWIGSRPGKHVSLWNCGISVWERHLHNYKEDQYIYI